MRILLTVHQFLPDFHAGTEVLTLDVAKALRARGHEVCVFTGHPARSGLEDGQRFDRYTHEGIAVERFNHNHEPMGGETNAAALEYDNRFFAAYFRDYLNKVRPDVAHFFHLQRLSASAIDVCQALGIPMVLTPTDFWLVCPTNQLLLPDHTLCSGPDGQSVNCLRHVVALTQPTLVKAGLDLVPDRLLAAMIGSLAKGVLPRQKHASYVRALRERPQFMKSRVRRVGRVTAPTRLMADILAKNGYETANIVFLPFGINQEGLHRKPVSNSDARLRVGFIGTLYEHKGAHVLLTAVRSLPDDFPIEVKIHGDLGAFPDYVARLRRIAANDSRVAFCGMFESRRISEVLAGLDVLVVPSIWYENTPLVIYSAQACGCPIIASNLGGMSEAVAHEENGLLFKAGDAADLARTIRRLAEDRGLLRRLEKNARKPKSIAQYAGELENVYTELLMERHAA